jgi:hypothetical protein
MNRIAPPRSDRATNERLALAGAIAWPSFFAASVATMVFFALVDPDELFDVVWPHILLPREFAYTLGFFVFWTATLGASSFTALLLRRPKDRDA